MTRATKIVATLGPASSDPDVLERMMRAGVDVVRLNFSHGTAQDHIDRADAGARGGRSASASRWRSWPTCRARRSASASSPTARCMLVPGAAFVLDARAHRARRRRRGRPGLQGTAARREARRHAAAQRRPDRADGRRGARRARCTPSSSVGGELSNNKGINKQGGGLTAPALTAKDMEDIKTAMSFQADYLAVSFPKNATDMEMARQLANVAGEPYRHKPALIAKIERSEAIPQLESILRASDGIMVARGDLAVEVGNAAVPALQKTHDPHGARAWTRSSSPPRR